jgi:argininosuccinate synthase
MDLTELRQHRVGVCLSGGLSSLALATTLPALGVDTVCFVADIGPAGYGPAGHGDVAELSARLAADGTPVHVVPQRAELARLALALVRYQASYDGGYWNTTGAAREVIVSGLVPAMRRAGCTVAAHGSVGGGNDQLRFQRYGRVFGADLPMLSLWTVAELRDRFPSRASMAAHLAGLGLAAVPGSSTERSTDANLAGVSHEGAELEELSTPGTLVEPMLGLRPEQAPDKAEEVAVRIENGWPTAINGLPLDALACLEEANRIAGRNGVGLRDVVENRVNGTKCRGIYEAPGMELLGHCVRTVYEVTVDEPTERMRRRLSADLAGCVYGGRYHGLPAKAARSALDVIAEHATATVRLRLYKGTALARSVEEVGPLVAPRQTRFATGGHRWEITSELAG